jgi:hypothetical protein
MVNPENRRYAVIALGVFATALASGGLARHLPSPMSTFVWKLCWVVLCFAGIRVANPGRPRSALDELGLRASPVLGVSVALLLSIPMLATFAITSTTNPHLEAVPLLMTAIVSPVSEELLFRGYLFLQLYRRAGWPFAAAVGTTAGVFGLAHVTGLAGRLSAVQVLGEVGMVAAGGALFAWLLIRWRDNLWVPIGLHSFMNLWCYAFACDERPGDLATDAGRLFTVAASLVVTAVRSRRVGSDERQEEPSASSSGHAESDAVQK